MAYNTFMEKGMPAKYSMFFNWIRWQCLNKEDWNGDEIPAGTMIDHDQYVMEVLKMMNLYMQMHRIAKEGTNVKDN